MSALKATHSTGEETHAYGTVSASITPAVQQSARVETTNTRRIQSQMGHPVQNLGRINTGIGLA